jgi:hypothetical protein
VRCHGSRAYPRLLLAAGATGQRICAAAARAGLFCRPARSVREDVLEAAVAAPAGHDFVYLLLAGRPRMIGPAYDLTPLAGPAADPQHAALSDPPLAGRSASAGPGPERTSIAPTWPVAVWPCGAMEEA